MKPLNSHNLLIASLLGFSTLFAGSYPLVKAQSVKPTVPESQPRISLISKSIVAQRQAQYIGQVYEAVYIGQTAKLPGSPRYMGSNNIALGAIGADLSKAPPSITYFLQGKNLLLTIDQFVGMGSNGSRHRIVDAITTPADGVRFHPSYKGDYQIAHPCSINGKWDAEIITIAKAKKTKLLTEIKQAWRANRSTGKFEEVSPKNIACENRLYGIQ